MSINPRSDPLILRRTLRNLIIFVFCIVALPWLGWALDVGRRADPHDQQNSLGWLFFIASPLLVILLLRTFAEDGWKDFGLWPRLRGNGKWYLFALLFHPLCMSIFILIGALLGVTSVAELSVNRLALLGGSILALSLSSFIKNIFEEFAWRGYLTPKIQSIVSQPLVGHILVGLIWFTWHLPYFLVLLPPEVLQKSTTLTQETFLFLTLLGIIPTAILYGELRLRTNSVWPAVLIHTGANVFFDALVLQNIFSMPDAGAELVLSPALFSLLTLAINVIVGLSLYHNRISAKKMPVGANLA